MDSSTTPATKPKSQLLLLGQNKAKTLWSTYGYLLLAGLIPAVLMYLLYVVHLIHPFGDESVLVLDLTGQYVFFFEKLRDILTGESSLFFSFTRALGGEFMGIFNYYVASPLSVIVALFPQDMMLEALLALFILKTGLCGFNMGFLLHKISTGSNNKLSVITFSVMYALTSYAVVYQHNTMWIDAVLWLPILAYGIQELIKRGRFRVFVVALSITIISNFYIGYMVCIFTAIYSIYYYFAHNQNNENNPTGEKNHLLRSVLRVLGWSILAVGIAAFTILSAYYSLSLGKNNFTNPDWSFFQKFELFDFFYKFLPSSYDTVTPRGLPLVYCGVLTLIMAPAFFLCKKFSHREKLAAAIVIMVFIVSMVVNPLDLIWHGFQKPQWLNYRYSFMLCFFLIMLAYRAFEQVDFISRKSLLGVTAFIALFVLVAQQLSDTLFTEALDRGDVKAVFRPYATIWLSLACLFLYFVIVALRGRVRPRFKEGMSVALLIIVCCEVFLNGISEMVALDLDVTYSGYSKYNNFLSTYRPIVAAVETYNAETYDDSFYRMDKTYYQKKDDNFALGMNGLSECTSTFNVSTQTFLRDMGYWSQSNYSLYVGGTVVTDSLLGLRYLIYSDEQAKTGDVDKYVPHPEQYYGAPILSPGDYEYKEGFTPIRDCYVYENPYALSWAYGVSEDWLTFDASQYQSPFHQVNAMITAMLGEDEPVEVFKPAVQNGQPNLENMTYSSQTLNKDKYPDGLSYHKYVGAKDETGKLTYSYTVPTDTELFFYLPADYSYRRQVKVTVNNISKETKDYGSNESNRIIALGQVQNPQMTLEIALNNTSNNLYIIKDTSYVFYIDMEVFKEAMDRLAAMPQWNIDKDSTDDHLIGTMTTANENQTIFTSITYDKAWRVYVDGQRVETTIASDALLSFTVENAGEHTIEMRYMPTAYAIGIACSALCAFIFLVLAIGYRWFCRIPLLKHVLSIQRADLPAVEAPEMKRGMTPGDIGADRLEETEPPEDDAL